MRSQAIVLREYGPFPDAANVGGVTFDGHLVWFATGAAMVAFDPDSGAIVRTLPVAGQAGTAFDGQHLYQIVEDAILTVDPATGSILNRIPAPGGRGSSGMAWAEGTLWVGQYRERKIYQIEPRTGQVLRTIDSNRFVTGVTWVDGELWHGTSEAGASELRRIDAASGAVQEHLDMPPDTMVSGLESDGGERFFCGGGKSGKVRVVRRPRRTPAAAQATAPVRPATP